MTDTKPSFMIEIGDQSSRQANGLLARPNKFIVQVYDAMRGELVFHDVDCNVLAALNPDMHRVATAMMKAAADASYPERKD